MKSIISGAPLRHVLAAAVLGAALSAVTMPAHAGLIGKTVGGCFTPDASAIGLTLNVSSCQASPLAQSLNLTVVDPGVEFGYPTLGGGRRADIGDNTITITYTAGSANSIADLFIFTGLDLDDPITGLTLIGSNTPGITTMFSADAAAFLVPEVCNVSDCNFSVTFRLYTAAVDVPLPGTLALAGLGLSAVAFGRRRKTWMAAG